MNLSPLARPLAVLLLVACSGAEPEDTDLPPPTPCGATPPTIDTVEVVDNGPADLGGGVTPTMRVSFHALDGDGALTAYTILVGYDDDVDGAVDLSDPLVATGDFGPHDCSIAEADLFMDIAVNGSPPPATFLELGVVLEDADGQRSDPPVLLTITSPQ
ncbi:MAG: hypothetical protein R3F61_36680 [Myxococcota bacterium]